MIKSTFFKKMSAIIVFLVCSLVFSYLLTSNSIVKPVIAAAASVSDSYVDYSKINDSASTNYLVSGGQLKMKQINGVACTTAGQCTSGFCVDGVCCNSACTGLTCQRCDSYSNAGTGTCGYVNNGSVNPDNECTASYNACSGNNKIGPDGNCSGTGYSCKPDGQSSACPTHGICQTGGGCSAGSCVAVVNAAAGTNPNNDCTASAAIGVMNACANVTCNTMCSWYSGQNATCNGSGACSTHTRTCQSTGTNPAGTNLYSVQSPGYCQYYGPTNVCGWTTGCPDPPLYCGADGSGGNAPWWYCNCL